MNDLHIKSGDTVQVISGNSKGSVGKVLATSPKEKVNMVTKHVKPKNQQQQGEIVKAEGALYACKVLLYCPKCKQGVRTGIKLDGEKKVRVCKKCGAVIE